MSDFSLSLDPMTINGYILVEMVRSDVSAGGIIIPEAVTERPMYGIATRVSSGYYEGNLFREHMVHEGDFLVFNWKAGLDLDVDGVDFRLIHEKDVIVILKGVNNG